jgi:hypothetical protein
MTNDANLDSVSSRLIFVAERPFAFSEFQAVTEFVARYNFCTSLQLNKRDIVSNAREGLRNLHKRMCENPESGQALHVHVNLRCCVKAQR